MKNSLSLDMNEDHVEKILSSLVYHDKNGRRWWSPWDKPDGEEQLWCSGIPGGDDRVISHAQMVRKVKDEYNPGVWPLVLVLVVLIGSISSQVVMPAVVTILIAWISGSLLYWLANVRLWLRARKTKAKTRN